MRHYRIKGIHNVESDVWDFYSLKEMYEHKNDCENWKYCIQDCRRYLGELWHDNDIRYFFNGKPVYKNIYTIVGFENNNAFADYYWILRPLGATDCKSDRYELWNNHSFYENIIVKKRYNNVKKNKGNYKKKTSKNHTMGSKRKVSDNR